MLHAEWDKPLLPDFTGSIKASGIQNTFGLPLKAATVMSLFHTVNQDIWWLKDGQPWVKPGQ
jgi:hypothetical protein